MRPAHATSSCPWNSVCFLPPRSTWSVVTVQAQGGTSRRFQMEHLNTPSPCQLACTPIGIELQRNTTVTSSRSLSDPDRALPRVSRRGATLTKTVLRSGRLTKPVTAIWAIKRCLHQAISPIQSLSILFFELFKPYSPSIYLPRRSHFSEASLDVEFSPELAGGFPNWLC